MKGRRLHASMVPGLIGCLALCGGARGVSTRPPASGPLTTLNGLLGRFGVNKEVADLVRLVDASGSMFSPPQPPYPGVLHAYRAFVGAASVSDFLSVVTFDSNAVPRLHGTLAGRGRAAALPALPLVANGSATDIGAALDGALARLSRPDSNNFQILLALTDGRNDPAHGSVYPEVLDGPAGAGLVGNAREQGRTHNVSVYGKGLTGIGQTCQNLRRSRGVHVRTWKTAKGVRLAPGRSRSA